MELRVLAQPFECGAMAGFLQDLCRDWHAARIEPPARYGLVEDLRHLWLLAAHDRPGSPHPDAQEGDFQEGLWRHDVAELFIAAEDGRYLEFNLSPRGAWWMAAFDAPRHASPLPHLPAVRTHAAEPAGGGWQAALGIPLEWLRHHIGWGPASRANVTLILESPEQRFLSAADLGGGEPDFHRPDRYPAIHRQPDGRH